MKRILFKKAVLYTVVVLFTAVVGSQLTEPLTSVEGKTILSVQEIDHQEEAPLLLARRGAKTSDGNINKPPKSSGSSSKSR